ncbi:response regulator [Allosalinactinospora lopnorensis]|uniref:response regulator n=1 Tax=Allosalinactinospora lopnorensis TaxID=1352348 RepID=UPI000695AA83
MSAQRTPALRKETHVSGQPPTPIRVLVVDDHAFFRRGLVSVIADESDIHVAGEAGDGEEAIRKAGDLVPDVVLMDVRMPRVNGIDACTGIKSAAPNAKIVMLTMSDEEDDLFEALKAGATGYLLKEVSVTELPQAVRAVADGQSFLNPSMATKLISEFTSLARRDRDKVRAQQAAESPLTDREMEVLKLIARGLSNRAISERLFITENTVKNHVRNILEKLHLHSRMEAAIYAVQAELIEDD